MSDFYFIATSHLFFSKKTPEQSSMHMCVMENMYLLWIIVLMLFSDNIFSHVSCIVLQVQGPHSQMKERLWLV